MIPHSALFEDAVRYSWSPVAVVDVVRAGVPILQDVKVLSGSVTSDRTSKTRWSSSLVLGLEPWEAVDINVFDTRVRVFYGIDSIGHRELLRLGEYRVDEMSREDTGHLSLTLSGLERYVIDDRFLRPRVPPYGVSTILAISQLVLESVPRIRVHGQCTLDRTVTATAPWEKERMDAALSLGDSIHAEVFCDHDGIFVIRDYPDLLTGVPVFHINQGNAGVMTSVGVTNSRDKVYNAISVFGESSDQDIPPVWAWTRDTDPGSPTYWDGEFGHVPRFYSSQFMTTEAQCQSTADSMLLEALAHNRIVQFGSSSIPFLEAGDIVLADTPDGFIEKHMINSTALDLGAGTMAMTTLATKADVTDA
jgi:hypothetical protein